MRQDWSADVEAGVEAAVEAAGPLQECRQTGGWRLSGGWRICLAVLAVGLCAAAAVCFSLHTQSNQKEDDTEGSQSLKLAMRQLSQRTPGGIQRAIHLEGEYNSGFSNASVEWRADQDQAFHTGRLELKDNEIVIPETGLYFVYSQVSFRVNCHVTAQQAQELGTVHLSHTVQRTSHAFEGQVTLLHALRSGCQRVLSEVDSGENWFSTINLGAVFSLQKHDRLNTVTEPLANVEGESGRNFFGVFAL